MRTFLFILLLIASAHATWKPEYSKNPPAVQEWFKSQMPPQAAAARLGIGNCCDHADRFMTKFVGKAGGEWEFYADPNCTSAGCRLVPIPNDVIHTEGIHALNPADESLPEFEAMRREGVLFIWQGKPTCFWPPEPSI